MIKFPMSVSAAIIVLWGGLLFAESSPDLGVRVTPSPNSLSPRSVSATQETSRKPDEGGFKIKSRRQAAWLFLGLAMFCATVIAFSMAVFQALLRWIFL